VYALVVAAPEDLDRGRGDSRSIGLGDDIADRLARASSACGAEASSRDVGVGLGHRLGHLRRRCARTRRAREPNCGATSQRERSS